jgi:GMP synthase (glutamine-hydrolysing)
MTLDSRGVGRETVELRAVDDGGVAGEPLKPVLLILHQPHSTPGHIGQWFAARGFPLDIRRPRFDDPLPSTLRGHVGAVIFGGPMSANDPDDYVKREIDLVGLALAEEAPFLGVCLGAQMMARQLGCRVAEHPEKFVEIGYHALEPTADGARLGAWPRRFYQWHREGFDLPASARLLARSDGPFENQAFAVGPAAIGLQFHPEITHAMVHRWTGHNMHRLAQPGAQQRAEQVEDHIHHGPIVRRWLDGLLTRWVTARL